MPSSSQLAALSQSLRQGKIVGYFIPVHSEAEADLVALKKASQSLDKLLSAPGVDVEDIVAGFKISSKKTAPATSAKTK